MESLKLLVLDYNCRLCGQLPNRLSDQVTVSLEGTNIGSWMCSFEDCHQSTSLFVAQIAVSASAICCFFAVCSASRHMRRQQQHENNIPAAEEQNAAVKKVVMRSVELLECVGSLVAMPGDGDQVFVALPVSQMLPLFHRGFTKVIQIEDGVAVGADSESRASAEDAAEDIRIPVGEEADNSIDRSQGLMPGESRLPAMTTERAAGSTRDSEDSVAPALLAQSIGPLAL
mmetsp:Transcript_15033/g.38650  ORF Transcript_15033/g.38650 Transcript_15033/m.38650 type:complete len:229 (-) Transcript_15033:167-853(-)